MKKLKTLIIVLLAIIMIIFIIIMILKGHSPKDKTGLIEADNTQDFINEMSLVNNYSAYFMVEKILNNYILQIAAGNEEAVYSMLNNTYIKQNNITRNNVISNILDIVKNNKNLRIKKMYGQTNLENEVYYVDCMLGNNKEEKEVYFEIYVDRQNTSYSIAHISKDVYEKETKHAKENLQAKTIEKNKYNNIQLEVPQEEEIASEYFKNFIENAVNDTEYAYSLLDNEYKNKRFPTLKDFKQYVEERYDLYSSSVTKKTYDDFDNMEDYVLYISKKQRLQLKSYQIRYEEGYTRYICMDNYNNYYVFKSTSPLNYTVMLDTYTIDLPEFEEKYSNATIKEKVGYNIQKIVEALNCSDYKYIYGKLADEFKQNYFKNYEAFEKYAKETFEIKNTVTYNKYTESQDLSTYQITLQGKSKTITKTIVMKLEEGTDFVMSFNVE